MTSHKILLEFYRDFWWPHPIGSPRIPVVFSHSHIPRNFSGNLLWTSSQHFVFQYLPQKFCSPALHISPDVYPDISIPFPRNYCKDSKEFLLEFLQGSLTEFLPAMLSELFRKWSVLFLQFSLRFLDLWLFFVEFLLKESWTDLYRYYLPVQAFF